MQRGELYRRWALKALPVAMAAGAASLRAEDWPCPAIAAWVLVEPLVLESEGWRAAHLAAAIAARSSVPTWCLDIAQSVCGWSGEW